ncbi:RNA-directed DNA polymerase, eukaryota [Tanacetum coccineum]
MKVEEWIGRASVVVAVRVLGARARAWAHCLLRRDILITTSILPFHHCKEHPAHVDLSWVCAERYGYVCMTGVGSGFVGGWGGASDPPAKGSMYDLPKFFHIFLEMLEESDGVQLLQSPADPVLGYVAYRRRTSDSSVWAVSPPDEQDIAVLLKLVKSGTPLGKTRITPYFYIKFLKGNYGTCRGLLGLSPPTDLTSIALIDFKLRSFPPVNRGRSQADFDNLLVDINYINVVDGSDSVTFSLSSNGLYSVKAIRSIIDEDIAPSSIPCTRWSKALPRKVNIFMWRLFLDKLPNRFNLSTRGLDIASIMCPICNLHAESISHILFSCNAAANIWKLIRGWCDLKIPVLNSCGDWDIGFPSWSASKNMRRINQLLFFSLPFSL